MKKPTREQQLKAIEKALKEIKKRQEKRKKK